MSLVLGFHFKTLKPDEVSSSNDITLLALKAENVCISIIFWINSGVESPASLISLSDFNFKKLVSHKYLEI